MPMRELELKRVRALPLFAGCADDTFRRLSAGAFLQNFPAGTTLLLEGDPVDFLYVLLDGIAELEGTWNDKATTLAILKPVSLFVLADVVLEAPGLVTARALERSHILMLSGQAIRRAMSEDPAFALVVAGELAGCNRGIVRATKNQKLRGGLERLANYLITQRMRLGGEATFTLPHEKRVLASLLGMTPENLSRAFAALASHGVEIDGPQVTITRPAALLRLAKPDPLIDNHQPISDPPTGKAERERWPVDVRFT
jgi:CRP/FNR family transcriptional regulator, transcriptional activator FtrB